MAHAVADDRRSTDPIQIKIKILSKYRYQVFPKSVDDGNEQLAIEPEVQPIFIIYNPC
ncbi:hypothetical protein [Chamaesiphon sp. VAR_48_metabat_403]|uniref:hypothetical protein n=1 Tax=Chamaesiphon sp. VAR_48_metabat_403 TaxID=2964700 RepID=UPI00286DD906|nr:hypothetical protein [Chamaesiphon sp. VAR_48_metabat_403]